jgi:transcriptional regulator of acetoin/glycerol metabolism
MKILVSWEAYMHDYLTKPDENGNRVNLDGPTFNFHRYYYEHDRHVILSGSNDMDSKTEFLASKLRSEFLDRSKSIEVVYMSIDDPIDINAIKTKVEAFLIGYHKEDTIDIFFSPGTSAMQISWYLCHTTLGLNTRLFQLRDKRFSQKHNFEKPELLEIKTGKSSAPYTALIREEHLLNGKEDYLITDSIKPVYEKAFKIAQTDSITTLISGESGTGKEHLAKYIHEMSIRKSKPFIPINCSAFTDQLLESRLFGYKKGSFTGAENDHVGLLQESNYGTIFLDEIGDISPYMQQVLLRVLQEKKIMRIGDNKEVKIDVRIIAATNKNLAELCRQEKFRWDLYYRLTVTELALPSLKERTVNERSQLVDYFLKSKKKLFKRTKMLIFPKLTREAIIRYSFPGNVRELENLIEQLYVFHDETVLVEDLPNCIHTITGNGLLDWKSVEKEHILKILKMTVGKKALANKILGYKSINTLKSKLIEYGIEMK